jgi:PDZ domain-containing secreted protein
MHDKSKHFLKFAHPIAPAPSWRNVLGASLLAVGMAALWSTPSFAQGTALSGVAAPVLVVNEQVAAPAAGGIVIVAVDEGGPAAKAGIVRGDILLTAGDVRIDSSAALYKVVLASNVGDEIELVVQHGDETRTIPVTLGQLGGRAYLGVQVVDSAGAAAAVPVPNVEIAPAMIDPAVTATATISTDVVIFAPGVVIADVLAGSPAAAAGLEAGDLIVTIDGQPVATLDDILNHLKGHTPGEVMQLTVQKGGVAGSAITAMAVTLGAAPGDPGRAYLGIQVVGPPSTVTIEGAPPPAFTAPAMPVAPGMPPLPGAAPYYGYPGAGASGACGTTIIVARPSSISISTGQRMGAPLAHLYPRSLLYRLCLQILTSSITLGSTRKCMRIVSLFKLGRESLKRK